MSAPIGYNLSPDILLLNTVKQNFCQKHDSGILVLYCWYLSIKWSWLDFKPAPSYRNFHVLYWWNMQSMSQKCKKNCFHFHLCSIWLIQLGFGRRLCTCALLDLERSFPQRGTIDPARHTTLYLHTLTYYSVLLTSFLLRCIPCLLPILLYHTTVVS